MAEVKYKLLTAQDRLNMAQQALLSAEQDHYRTVLASVDPENDQNVATQAARVERLQKATTAVEAEAKKE
jgi:hypothetical protein